MSTSAVTTIFLVALIITTLGFMLGKRMGFDAGVRAERRRVPPPPRAICPCGHSIGEHKELKSCQAQVRRPFYYATGSRNGHEWITCPCTRYYGPKPIPADYFHPGTLMLEQADVDD